MNLNEASSPDPHAGTRTLLAGARLEEAAGALIAVHGRGASADDIVSLAQEIAPPRIAIVAPEAAGSTWYPYRFLEPTARNEPYLGSALRRIRNLFEMLDEQGLPPERIALVGFSQGACLALESSARDAQRYAAIVGFSGGLIGPPGTKFSYPGSFAGTPVLLGCSDIDAHIPVERVYESAAALSALGASVDTRIYPGMGHTVTLDEIRAARLLLNEAFFGTSAD